MRFVLAAALAVLLGQAASADPLGYIAIPLGTLGQPGAAGEAINSTGQVTGYVFNPQSDEAFLYSGGVMTGLGTLGGGEQPRLRDQ